MTKLEALTIISEYESDSNDVENYESVRFLIDELATEEEIEDEEFCLLSDRSFDLPKLRALVNERL